ncbi:MAG: hypothetical protein GYA02_00970 [Clostridiaceae bacterium]|nr:hypothetical protein [Clostridiaceae bacterium]
MCDYCEGKKPLTDKIYDDGSKFDDMLSTRIEYMGNIPMIVSEYKISNFHWPFCNVLTQEEKKSLSQTWAVTIEYCPKCGSKLI